MPVKKRELASYLLLYSSGKETMSIEYARKLLGLILPSRSIRSVIRMLARSGFIEVSNKEIKIRKPEEALGAYLSPYIRSRIERNARSKHIRYEIEKKDGVERIYISQPGCVEVNIAIGSIEIACKQLQET